jgi:hypothetical protein
MLICVFVICLFVIIILFSFPRFSPIPYFPSNKKDLPLILRALNLRDNQTVIDLGAGDGIVIFEAAKLAFQKELNTKFIAIEINPILIIILYIRRLFNQNKNNITIIQGDMFTYQFQSSYSAFYLQSSKLPSPITFYLYISPWLINKALTNIIPQFPNAEYVSYFYPIKKLREKKKVKGIHFVYSY